MRIGLRGSSSQGRLGSLSQHSTSRSRSGTGTWSRVGSGGSNAWPRRFIRGSIGSSGGPRAPASWTKLSAATRTPRLYERSPSQRSAAEIFSAPDTSPSQHQNVRSAVQPPRVDECGGTGHADPVDEPWWTGDTPFRGRRQSGGAVITKDESTAGETTLPKTSRSNTLTPLVKDWTSAETKLSHTNADESRRGAEDDLVASDLSDAEYDRLCHNEDRHCLFAPKTICVISRFPIYGVLRRFLRHLYAISLSRSGVPLERYISMFVSCIPMPPPGEVDKLMRGMLSMLYN